MGWSLGLVKRGISEKTDALTAPFCGMPNRDDTKTAVSLSTQIQRRWPPPIGLNAERYEFWLYRQIRKRFQSGEFHLNHSLRHQHFSDELVPEEEEHKHAVGVSIAAEPLYF